MELGDLALGLALLMIGAVSTSVSILYWSASGLTLLSFGLFALLSGLQQLLGLDLVVSGISLSSGTVNYVAAATNYWLPVPGLIFFEQTLGSGWWSPFRRIWQGWCVLATGFLFYDLAWGAGSSLAVQSVCVVVLLVVLMARVVGWGLPRTPERFAFTFGFGVYMSAGLHDILLSFGFLPWGTSLNASGLRIFVLSMGYVTTQRFFSAQRELATVEYELRTASDIQASILPRGVPSVRGLDVAARYEPMRMVGGDLYDFVSQDRQAAVLVADVTGHGVPAALIASMAKVAFTSQADAVGRPGDLLAGMNRALCGQMEAQFVTASYVSIDLEARCVRYSTAGHPPPLLWRRQSRQIVELTAGGIFLGFDPSAAYPTREIGIEPGDRVVMYTDGLLEATNAAGQFFGSEGLKAFVEANSATRADEFADSLLARLRRWTGRRGGGPAFEDDVTLVVVNIEA